MPSPESPPTGPAARPPSEPEDKSRFRSTLVRVMSMQVVALLALWWLQSRYAR